MALKPWHTVATPREDLREGRPLDASEFAVHLDQVRDGRAPKVYQTPEEFFERTYLTQNLTALASEVIRRLSGIRTETSAVFNMTTQFGGGKTHALTLLYHLANGGPKASGWRGVRKLLDRAGVTTVPQAATAVFVGNEFDSIEGRGGKDGTPVRKTPWGEIAYQLGGEDAFRVVARHEEEMIAPGGDVIRRFLPQNRPCLILIDELMNYISRNRKSGLGAQLYNFLQNLSEEARGRDNLALAVSIPESIIEMNADDQPDYERYKKLLDRLGKAVIMSAEAETSEIIRRRLFEWNLDALTEDGRVILDKDATQTCREYAQWMVNHRLQLPAWFPIDNAQKVIEATYPFHPALLSVFERKWRALPRFQQTRGILRLLALWVSKAYQDGFKGAHKDPLIGLGTAPLDDALFRAAVFEQLGEQRLEAAVTTDICGKTDSFATRLDKEAVDSIRKGRLHRKVATAIFFESNGGQARAEATDGEIRLAVGDPTIDLAYVGTVLEALTDSCYYLSVEGKKYRFSLMPNLNKLLSDRRASIKQQSVTDRVRAEVQKVFSASAGASIERVYFPSKSNEIADRAALTLVVLPPDHSFDVGEKGRTLDLIETMTRECGASARTFKSSLIWAVPSGSASLLDDARKLLAWEEIANEADSGTLQLDDTQKRQLGESLGKARRDLNESVWRTYRFVVLLGKDNKLREVDLGLIHSSSAESIGAVILNRLRGDGDIEREISPNFLVRNWPPAFKEWSTKSARDAFFASPQFPRLMSGEAVRETIARGVSNKIIAYVGKGTGNKYAPFEYGVTISPAEVEISDEMFIITKETAEAYLKSIELPPQQPVQTPPPPSAPGIDEGSGTEGRGKEIDEGEPPPQSSTPPEVVRQLRWEGEIPRQKWTNFYTKVVSKFGVDADLRINLRLDISATDGLSPQKIEEMKIALRELGLDDGVEST